MKQIKYYLSIVLSVLIISLPFATTAYCIYHPNVITGVIAGTSIIACIFLMKFIDTFRQNARREIEYDEFGRSKKKGRIESLSKKERETLDLQQLANSERLICGVVIRRMAKKGSDDPEADINKLIGLDMAKNKMKEMAARMKFEKMQNGKNKAVLSGRHAVFFGNPGTGKTTMCKIMTGFLYKYGYIKENKYIETDGNFLKAGTETGKKTQMLCQFAYGKVLFIDEAYALMTGDNYGRDAIATLIKEMEDNRDKFVVILAGYTKEMKNLLISNPGFESRIKEYFEFSDYSENELRQIFSMMANEQGFVVDSDALIPFDRRMEKEKKLPSFGNARTVRNVLNEAIDKHALNHANGVLNADDTYKIKGIDIPQNITENYYKI